MSSTFRPIDARDGGDVHGGGGFPATAFRVVRGNDHDASRMTEIQRLYFNPIIAKPLGATQRSAR